MRFPRATVTVDDPRKLGRHTSLGYAEDFPWVPPEGGFAQLWQFDDCEYIPSQQAVGPRGTVTRPDMDISEWTVAAGSWTDKARLAMTPRTLWLWNYNTLETAVAGIRSDNDYPAQVCVWASVAAANESSTVTSKYIQIILVGDGGTDPAWGIEIPTGPGSYKFPRLLYYDAGVYTVTPQVVSEYDEWAGGGDALSSARDFMVWIEPTATQWIIGLAVNGNFGTRPWVYQPPGYTLADALTHPLQVPGPIQLQSSGQAALFAVAPIVYPETSTARTRAYYTVDASLGAAADAYCSPLIWQPVGTTVTPTTQVNGTAVRPVVTLKTTDPFHTRPLVGATALCIDAVIGDVTTSAWSSASRANSLLGAVTYTRRTSWKGNSVRATVHDTEGLDWRGNNVVQLLGAWYETGSPEPVQEVLFTGMLVAPEGAMATELAYRNIEIEALDWAETRGKRMHMANMRAMGGHLFADMFGDLANRAGFANTAIDINAGHGGYQLSYSNIMGERTFVFRDDALIAEALDAICADIGWRWGIRPNGDIFTEPYPAYAGPADYVLDADVQDEDTWYENIVVRRDMEHYANVVFSYCGAHPRYRGSGLAYSFEAVSDPASRFFMGGVLSHVIQTDTFGTNAVAAALGGRERDRRLPVARTIEFSCARQAALAPDAFVSVSNVDGVDDETIFMVVEEQGTIDLDGLDWTQRITMVEVDTS